MLFPHQFNSQSQNVWGMRCHATCYVCASLRRTCRGTLAHHHNAISFRAKILLRARVWWRGARKACVGELKRLDYYYWYEISSISNTKIIIRKILIYLFWANSVRQPRMSWMVQFAMPCTYTLANEIYKHFAPKVGTAVATRNSRRRKYVVKMLLSLLLLWIYANRLCRRTQFTATFGLRARQTNEMLHGWVGRVCVWYWTTNNGLSFRLRM